MLQTVTASSSRSPFSRASLSSSSSPLSPELVEYGPLPSSVALSPSLFDAVIVSFGLLLVEASSEGGDSNCGRSRRQRFLKAAEFFVEAEVVPALRIRVTVIFPGVTHVSGRRSSYPGHTIPAEWQHSQTGRRPSQARQRRRHSQHSRCCLPESALGGIVITVRCCRWDMSLTCAPCSLFVSLS